MNRAVGALAVALVVMTCDSAYADCQGGPTFSGTVVALDRDSLGWSNPTNVDYARGDLSQLPAYTLLARGTLFGTMVLDISLDNPAPGQGLYYLVKGVGPPCGSWQSSNGAEPARDILIQPPCSQVNPSQQDIEDAVDNAVAGVIEPSWEDYGTLLEVLTQTQADIGCVFEESTFGTFESPVETSEGVDCDTTQCEDVQYCGWKNSTHSKLVGQAGSCLNDACFDHDLCYRQWCVTSDPGCGFSVRSQGTPCDPPLFAECLVCPAQDGGGFFFTDSFICAFAAALQTALDWNPACYFPACDGAEEDCCSSSGRCVPLEDATCDGIDDDCDGETDEEYAPETTVCGLGACTSTGMTSCINGIVVDDCVPGVPTPEVCDDIDNNCDGQIDEGLMCSATVFFDDFNRPNSNTVGNGWSEVEISPAHARIAGNRLSFPSDDAAVAYRPHEGGAGGNDVTITWVYRVTLPGISDGVSARYKTQYNAGRNAQQGLYVVIHPDSGYVSIGDGAVQKGLTPFVFDGSTDYNFQWDIFPNNSMGLWVWKTSDAKPASPTLTISAFTPTSDGTYWAFGNRGGSFFDDFKVKTPAITP